MFPASLRRFRLLAAFLLISFLATAQSPAALPLPARQSILNGRATLSFPAAAVNQARSVGIMSASPSENRETRIMQDFDGEARLVVFARELFRLAGPEFTAQAAAFETGPAPDKARVLLRTDSVVAVLCTPTRYDSTAGAIRINRLLVRTVEGTVFCVDAYVNPKGFAQRAGYQALTEKIFATLRPGRRLLPRAARAETLDSGEKGAKLAFHLPADYAVTSKTSYDFTVYNLFHLTDLAATGHSGTTVYVGSHPSPLYRDMELKAEAGRAVPGRLLGQKVQWLEFAKPEQQLYWREQIVPGVFGKEGRVVHVVMNADAAATLPELTKVVEAIELTK